MLAIELVLGSLCMPLLAVALVCGLRYRCRLKWQVGATLLVLSMLFGVTISIHLSELMPLGLAVLTVAVVRVIDKA